MLAALFDTGQKPVGRHERNVLQAEPTSVGQIRPQAGMSGFFGFWLRFGAPSGVSR
jgi:hypothetical protein